MARFLFVILREGDLIPNPIQASYTLTQEVLKQGMARYESLASTGYANLAPEIESDDSRTRIKFAEFINRVDPSDPGSQRRIALDDEETV